MALSNYDELKVAVLEWLARAPDDEDLVVTRTEDFITLCEARLARELRVKEMHVRSTTELNEETEGLPLDQVDIDSLHYQNLSGKWSRLKFVQPAEYRAKWSNAGKITDDPCVYTVMGCELFFGPSYDWSQETEFPQLEFVYYQRPPSLNSTNQTTNAILTNYPQIYLSGSLAEASKFIISEQLAVWENTYMQQVQSANDAAQEAVYGTSVRSAPSGVV